MSIVRPGGIYTGFLCCAVCKPRAKRHQNKTWYQEICPQNVHVLLREVRLASSPLFLKKKVFCKFSSMIILKSHLMKSRRWG